MTDIPISHLTLYKHGVGFFERRAKIDGESVSLTFHVNEMNDVLKSLTTVDWGQGQVLGVEYATPKTVEQRLEGCSVRLTDHQSLQALLVSLRGRRVRLFLDQGETPVGTLVGVDDPPEKQPLATGLVSVLEDDSATVRTITLGRLQGLEILDQQGADDLRFFLQASLAQPNHRQVTIQLSPGQHDLSVSYIVPAPTWRVSYRLATDLPNEKGEAKALLQGWGIFDNTLEEDLENIELSLVAGMPISFVYDLYTPFMPERPEVKEDERVAPGPVAFDQAVAEKSLGLRSMAADAPAAASVQSASVRNRRMQEGLADSVPVTTTGQEMGELFQYVIGTPVSVGRGQSAMVPILSCGVEPHKDLIYNGRKLPGHPVATMRFQNDTGLTLERGPATVLEAGDYVGEAILPLTAPGAEIVVPYAVELGAKISEEQGRSREHHGLNITGHFLQIEDWEIIWRQYRLNNGTGRPLAVLIEHPRTAHFELFDTPEPVETTEAHLRFKLDVPAHGEASLMVKERRLVRRREEIRKQTPRALQQYLNDGILSGRDKGRLEELLSIWSQIAAKEQRLKKIDQERGKVYKAQEQIQANMQALSTTGKEGALRASYVDRLAASEEDLADLQQEETQLKAEIEKLNAEVDKRVATLK
ncbi:MAG: hypothetical protein U9R25_02680 [Chloroflexota bacterium]|nr:hypothetical protein [Chloroflexota bacterium]